MRLETPAECKYQYGLDFVAGVLALYLRMHDIQLPRNLRYASAMVEYRVWIPLWDGGTTRPWRRG